MAVPKKRTGHSAQGKRRSNWKAAKPELTTCPNCGAKALTHTVCTACGTYKGQKGSEGVTPHGREVIFAVSEGRSRNPAQDYKNPGTRFRGSCPKFHRMPQQCAPCSYLTLFR